MYVRWGVRSFNQPVPYLTFVLQPPCTLTGCDTAGAGEHRLIKSVPSRPADVAVTQNDLFLPPSTIMRDRHTSVHGRGPAASGPGYNDS